MASTTAPQRDFLLFQKDFEAETKLTVKDNIPTYIAYCQLRQAENLRSGMVIIANHIVEEIRKLKTNQF